ncbi:MAG: hypothetical protein QGF00_02315 [Planctomycetota bacterium]|nr:hypothetical protein [Planctomycetota bacterium]
MRKKPRSRQRKGAGGLAREQEEMPLFNPALSRLSKAFDLVEALLLDEARSEFTEYLKVFPSDAEILNAYSSLEWLGRGKPGKAILDEGELYDWWRTIRKDGERYDILNTQLYRRLKKGILHELVQRLAASGQKNIHDFHIGLLYFQLEQYPEAIRELRLAIGQQTDASSLLGPLAEALYRAGDRKQADVSYGLALLYEPLKAGFKQFAHRGITNTQEKLEETGMSYELSRENLLVQCWLEGVIGLPPMPSVVSLQQLITKIKDIETPADIAGRFVDPADARVFRWALQIAFWIRNEAPHLAEELGWLHELMHSRDERAFEAYSERLRLEELQEKETMAPAARSG